MSNDEQDRQATHHDPDGVDVTVGADNLVTVKGPRGVLTQSMHGNMSVHGRRRR